MLTLTVKDLVDFYAEYPEEIGNLKAETRFGFKTIEYADVTAFDSQIIRVVCSCGRFIECSPDHKMLSGNYQWVLAKDLKIGDFLFGVDWDDKTEITSLSKLDFTEDLYDLQIQDVHEFIANGLVSHNSSMIETICYVLYGKPYRNINKPLLINSVNGKNLLGELEFTVSGVRYRVVRGMKPNIFEIYANEEFLNQDAHTKDYQQILEQQILKLNYKTFVQTVIVGAAAHVPFMQLSTGARREIIEDLLDIRVFSSMNQLLKERISQNKDEISSRSTEIRLLQDKYDLLVSQKERLQTIADSAQKDVSDQVSSIQEQINSLQVKTVGYEKILEEYDTDLSSALSGKSEELSSLLQKHGEMKRLISDLVKEVKFYENNNSCPTCFQIIPDEFKNTRLSSAKNSAKTSAVTFQEIESSISSIRKAISDLEERNSVLSNIKGKIKSNNSVIKSLEAQISQLQNRTSSSLNEEEIKAVSDSIASVSSDVLRVSKGISSLNEDRAYLDIVSELLKDTGIKTRIIRQYIPVINKLINQYLHLFDFFVSFNLDDSFTEVIKSRYRDQFTYSSFSEGEKCRIDLAILFTWRQVSRMKNSAATNLLILDEVMDSSMDSVGTDALMNILSSLEEGSNCFVISHNHTALLGKFDRTLQFQKIGNFSSVSEVS